jgi:hypothetical protein
MHTHYITWMDDATRKLARYSRSSAISLSISHSVKDMMRKGVERKVWHSDTYMTITRPDGRPHVAERWRRSITPPPLSVNPTAPILPLWIIAVLRLFWRNVVSQAGRTSAYNQKKPRTLQTVRAAATDPTMLCPHTDRSVRWAEKVHYVEQTAAMAQ